MTTALLVGLFVFIAVPMMVSAASVIRSVLPVGVGKFALAWLLRKAHVFERLPQLQLRGRFPLTPWRKATVYVNHSQGVITSMTEKIGPRSRNSRTGKTTYDLPGPLKWVKKRSRR